MPPIVLSVAEKPSVAKEIAAALSGGRAQRRGGGFPPLYVFDGTMPGLGAVEMHVTSVAGHVIEQEFEGRYRCVTAGAAPERGRARRLGAVLAAAPLGPAATAARRA